MSRPTRCTARSGRTDPPFTERTPYAPNSPYAASKAASDHLVRAYHHTYGLPVTTSNCSNNYGPYQFPEKLIPLMLVQRAGGQARCRSTATARTCAIGSTSRTTAGRSRKCCCVAAWERPTTSVEGPSGPTWTWFGSCASSSTRPSPQNSELRRRFPNCPASTGGRTSTLITFVRDRPGHDRRYAIDAGKTRAGAGVASSARLSRRGSGRRSPGTWSTNHGGGE